MNKLNIYCISLEPNHYDFIKQLGYKPVGLGEKIFNENCFHTISKLIPKFYQVLVTQSQVSVA